MHVYLRMYVINVCACVVYVCGTLGGGRGGDVMQILRKKIFYCKYVCVCVKGKSADKAVLLCGPNVITVIFTLPPTLQVRN